MTADDLLLRALHDTADPPLRPLPEPVAHLLRDLGAPPRLAAHLRAVRDVACQLVDWIVQRYPALRFERDAVLFGAATHDIGKTAHLAELSGPGSAWFRDGLAHRVLVRLEAENLVDSDGAGTRRYRYVTDPTALLDLWAEEDGYRPARTRAFVLAQDRGSSPCR